MKLGISAAFVSLALWASLGFCAGGEEPGRPNVLFIAVDDLRPEILSFGSPDAVTPNIDKLAAAGVHFRRAYCMVPTCGASRASLMTSIRPARNRFVTHLAYAEKEAPDAKPLHTYFKESGFHTVSLGKIFHHPDDHEDGWSEKPWRARGGAYATEEAKRVAKPDAKGVLRGPATEAGDVEDAFYPDGRTAAMAVEKLREGARRGGPFFLAVGFVKPHLPFAAPAKYWELYDGKTVRMPDNYFAPKGAPGISIHQSGELRAYADVPKTGLIPEPLALRLIHGYHACVSYVDAQVGAVLGELDRLGLRDNTVVVLWGDHGWNLGEHTLWCKHSCYETSLRAPLIVSAPGREGSATGGSSSALVEFIDIYPTLCELAGLPVPGHVEGKSLVPVLKDPAAAHKDVAISRFTAGDTIRSDRFRYTIYTDKAGTITARMLYDHEVDPDENTNIAADPEHAALVNELEFRLLRDMGRPFKKGNAR